MKLPPGFKILEQRIDGFMATGKIFNTKYLVISSIGRYQDGNRWLHVSVANRNKMPNYQVMKFIKATFMNQERDAVEVHARTSNHVNIHSNCRHLWMNLDADFLPDFTHGTGSI